MSDSYHNPFHNELKKEFQLERMILFSDAVFAIAITLLALEIKVPQIDKHIVTDALLGEKLDELIPKFIGFLVSFFVIGLYWMVHHRMFGFVVNYTPRLLWLNMFFLLAVVLMPFSSAFYSEYIIRQLKTPVMVYVGNIMFLGIMSLLLWNYLVDPRHRLTEGITPQMINYFRFRAVAPLVVFAVMAVIYLFVRPDIAVWMPLLIAPLVRLARRFFLKDQLIK